MISVIIPAFNAADYIERAIKSVLTQDVTDLELIVVNDGSSDETLDILQQAAARDSRLKIHTIKNSGAFAARIHGVKNASGEWISFVDADDTMRPKALSSLMAFDNGDRDIIVGTLNLNNEQVFRHGISGDISPTEYTEAILSGNTSIGNYGKLFKKKLFSHIPDIPREIFQNEDLLLLLHLSSQAARIYIASDTITYDYLFRNDSISKSATMPLEGWLALFGLIEKAIIIHHKVSPSIYEAFTRMRLLRLYENVILCGSFFDPAAPRIKSIITDASKIALSERDSKMLRIISSLSAQKTAYRLHHWKQKAKHTIKKVLHIK